MKLLSDFSKRVAIALAVACVALPAVAFDGPTDFAPGGNGPDGPGPGDWGGPGDLVAPSGGDGTTGPAPAGSGNSIVAQRNTECPNGNLIVDFDFDADGHPIPSSFSRTCVPFR